VTLRKLLRFHCAASLLLLIATAIEVAMDDGSSATTSLIFPVDTKVSFNDMVIKACAMALKKHPKLILSGRRAITINHHVNIELQWL
jgi:pyruvate dehydrogenase E2 component (dihydrolipoamide acetyltransferase)